MDKFFDLHAFPTYVALFCAVALAGFAWSFGCWVFGLLTRPRR